MRTLKPKTRMRSGVALLEVLIATVLLAAAMLLLVHCFRLWTAQERRMSQERVARNEAANLLERITQAGVRPGDELAAFQLSTNALELLPDANLAIQVDPVTDPSPELVRVSASIDWRLTNGARSPAIKLVTFVRAREASP